ncbi:phosphomevalonate kinase [Streptococcus sciuri]|uniref:phosphomevalonate kinase n=1 Tax=Streptococcus sciuri TaxID=2973939 RepID=A0ABT2F4P3_9STRE|nr:phosphomevalonate kinase [Streptococcus sciuri]MCS4487444.1 phosphomevalonate kinase [Streptococcus sciuri]
MIEVKTGGKLYIAGEYAILAPQQTALLAFIPIYMTAHITPNHRYQISSDMFSYSCDVITPDANYALIQETVAVMEEYLLACGYAIRPFSLIITGKLERDGVKLGIGSSGSVVVLILKAMVALYQIDVSEDLLFKLAAYVLLKRGDNGSMGDVACIAYESLLAYTSFDREAVRHQIALHPLPKVLASDWGYSIRRVTTSLDIDFLVGWTKQSSISKEMIKCVKKAIDTTFLSETDSQVLRLITSLETGDKLAVKTSLETISTLLEQLSPVIYNEQLKRLKMASVDLDCVAKSSGAGGGDCGIALSFDALSSKKLMERWREDGIVLLLKERLSFL